MPIKGLTDNVLPAFPRLGKLRKGGAKPATGFGYGKDLEYFRFTSERPEVQAVFTQAYGAQPALLNVYLPYASLDDNFQAWQEEWSAGGLVHRCDGETMTIWRTPTGYSQKPEPCPWRNKERTTKAPGCKAVGRLTVVIPELIRAGFVGYVTLETHSKHDLLSIQATLLAVIEARSGIAAGLRGIPFVLRRVPETISTPGTDGKRVSREKWLIKLEPVADWVSLQLETARSLALPGDRQPLQLTSGKLVDQRTGEVLDAPDDDEDIVEAEAVTPLTKQKPLPSDSQPLPKTLAEAYKQGAQDGAANPAIVKSAAATTPKLTPNVVYDASGGVDPKYEAIVDDAFGWEEMQSASEERAAQTETAFVPPVCPKCGGAMKDERAKREQAKAEGKPKPPPAWKCASGSWSKEGGQVGCDGVIWPSDPNEEGAQVQTSKKTTAAPAPDIITAINDLAVKLYGRAAAGPTMKPWLNDDYGVSGPSLKATLALLTPEQQQDVLTKLQVAAAQGTEAPTA